MYRNQLDRLELRINNYLYKFDGDERGKGKQRIFVWKCHEKNCPVIIKTDDEGNNEIICGGKKHNHESFF
jgi:hypothetical protein